MTLSNPDLVTYYYTDSSLQLSLTEMNVCLVTMHNTKSGEYYISNKTGAMLTSTEPNLVHDQLKIKLVPFDTDSLS